MANASQLKALIGLGPNQQDYFWASIVSSNCPHLVKHKPYDICTDKDKSVHRSVWAASSKKVRASMRKMHEQIILRMRKVLSGSLHSIHTFCSIQWFCYRTVKTLIRLRGSAGLSGPSLSAYAQIHVSHGAVKSVHIWSDQGLLNPNGQTTVLVNTVRPWSDWLCWLT